MPGLRLMDHFSVFEDVLAGRSRSLCELTQCVGEMGRPNSVLAILRDIVDDDEQLTRSASLSSTHPLGFDKLVLHSTDRYQVRLHIWWPHLAPQREDIHDHRFDFISSVVTGRLYVENYAQSASSALTMNGYAERHALGTGRYDFDPLGSLHVSQIGSSILQPGSVQFTSAEILHRVRASEGELTVTFFVKAPVVGRAKTTVLISDDAEPPVKVGGSMLSTDVFRERVAGVLAAL
jgi:hypothetical protein